MYDLHIGDTITCRDAKDAGNVGDELCKEGYLWDFRYEYDKEGNKKILIVIEGYQSDLEETKWG